MRRPVSRRLAAGALAVLALGACGGGEDSGGPMGEKRVDQDLAVVVVALDHPPVRQIMGEVDGTIAQFGDRVRVRHLDFESEQGQGFAEDKGVTGHVPLAIFLDGSPEATVNGRTARFVGFPRGRAPVPVAQGDWTLDELRGALAQRAGEPR
ncbi:MAG: hypothetical protein M3404_05225 [Actinomycetota bacterium]|nr:hypothetical protein [Actinomycetota bacterium]